MLAQVEAMISVHHHCRPVRLQSPPTAAGASSSSRSVEQIEDGADLRHARAGGWSGVWGGG